MAAGQTVEASRLPQPPRYAPSTAMHLLRVSVAHGRFTNCVISAFLYLIVTVAGGIWGVAAVYCFFKMEVALRGQSAGLVAAGFLPSSWRHGPYLRCGSP